MNLHSDTEIYDAVVALAKHIARAVADLRNDMKPSLGKMLMEESIWMAVLVRRANIARDQAKLQPLTDLLEQVEIVQFGLRLAHDLNYLPHSKFSDSLPLTTSVAKQATALRNHFVPATTPVA